MGSGSGAAALQLLAEESLRIAALAAVKESGLFTKEDWVRDFLVESVVAEVQEGGLPTDAADALRRFAELIHDNVQQAEPDEVQDFAVALHRRLAAAAESAARELDSGDGDSDGDSTIGGCAMCGREMPLTLHHLIPRDVHGKYKKKGLTQEQLCAGVRICRPCHSAIHRTYDNKTLAAQYSTLEQLLQSEPLVKFIAWARKQKVTTRQDVNNPSFRYRR